MILFLPELALSLMALVFFSVSLAKPNQKQLQGMGLFLSALAVAASVYTYGQNGTLFFDAYRIDAFSQLFKIIITLGLFIVIYLGQGLSGIGTPLKSEYYLFLTLSALGLACMSSAVELITIILCLEIASFALFIIIPFRKHGAYRKPMEAGIKYVLFGAAASGISRSWARATASGIRPSWPRGRRPSTWWPRTVRVRWRSSWGWRSGCTG